MDRLDRLILLAEDGQVDPGEVGPEPRAPDHVRRLEDAVVLEQRQPAPHAHDPRDAFDAGGGDVFGLHPDERRAVGEELRAHLSADRRAHGQDAVADDPEHQRQEDEPCRCALDAEGDVAALLPREPRRVLLRPLDGDLGAGVPDSDDEHRPSWSCEGFRYSPEWSWTMRGSSSCANAGTRGTWWLRHRYDHVVSLEPPVARLDDEAAAVPRQPVHPDAGSNREPEPCRVRLEVVGHLVLGGEHVRRAGEGHARQGVVAGGREEAKRVPPLPPGVADPLVGVEDDEGEIPLGEVVPDCEARLAAAHYQGLDALRCG